MYHFFVLLDSNRYRLDVVHFNNLQDLEPKDFKQEEGE
jgi:hypothetical protein